METRSTFITYCAAHPYVADGAGVHCSRNSREFLFGRSIQWWMNMIFWREKKSNQFRNGLVPFISICSSAFDCWDSLRSLEQTDVSRFVGNLVCEKLIPFSEFDGISMFHEWNLRFSRFQRFHTNHAHFSFSRLLHSVCECISWIYYLFNGIGTMVDGQRC